MATYGGQNVGAGKLDRLPKGVWTAGLIGSIYSVVILGVLWLWGKYLFLLFVSADETVVITQAGHFLLINACFYIPLAYVNIMRFMIQGMGFSGFAVFAGVFEMIARTLVGLFLVPRFGFTAACFASPLAWIFADIFLIPAFYLCLHKLQKKITRPD
jgi:Na+-driven multidrug efflux pump